MDFVPIDKQQQGTVLQFWADINADDFVELHNFSSADSVEAVRLKNRIAAKKCREKKNKMLLSLEATNDVLRQEALKLSRACLSLKIENKLLEDDIKFFQSYMAFFIAVKK